MLTDHVLGIDAKVTQCCETLALNSSSASSSVVVNVVQELEDKERRKKNMLFLTFLSQMHQIWRLIVIMFPSFVRIATFDLDVKIFESILSWQEHAKQMQAIVSAV